MAGCKGPHCPGCHNPEGWDFDKGVPALYCYNDIHFEIIEAGPLIDSIRVLGGEPLDQDTHQLVMLLKELKKHKKPIWLFTRYGFADIPQPILDLVDVVKTGEYKEGLKPLVLKEITLASDNQQIITRHVQENQR